MQAEFVKEIQNNRICSEIMKSINDVPKVDINFTESEIWALYETCFVVYNSFCNNSDEDDGLSNYMNKYLDDLDSAMKKLTW